MRLFITGLLAMVVVTVKRQPIVGLSPSASGLRRRMRLLEWLQLRKRMRRL